MPQAGRPAEGDAMIKFEYRNPKSETNSKYKIKMIENKAARAPILFVLDFGILSFVLVSDFDIRASDFTPH